MADEKRLPVAVRTASWVSFFADVASEMVYPIIPLFVVGVLRAPAAVLGLTEGLAEAIVSVMKAASGVSSDRRGKRLPYIHWGYGLSAIAKPLIGVAYAWPMVTFARGLDRFGKGIRGTARDALISDAVEPEMANRAFGFHRAMDTAGAFVGVLLGYGLLRALSDRMRVVFLIAAIPGLASLALTFLLKETAPKPNVERKSKLAPLGALPRDYYRVLAVLGLFSLANSSDTFLLLRARDLGLTLDRVVLAYALYNLTYAALSYPFGLLSDRIGRMPVMVGGWLLYGITYLGFAYLGLSMVWVLMPLYGLYMAATDGVGKALVASVAPKELRGTAMGLLYMATGLLGLVASVLAGVLWDRVGHGTPFLVGGAVALVTAAIAPLLLPRRVKA